MTLWQFAWAHEVVYIYIHTARGSAREGQEAWEQPTSSRSCLKPRIKLFFVYFFASRRERERDRERAREQVTESPRDEEIKKRKILLLAHTGIDERVRILTGMTVCGEYLSDRVYTYRASQRYRCLVKHYLRVLLVPGQCWLSLSIFFLLFCLIIIIYPCCLTI